MARAAGGEGWLDDDGGAAPEAPIGNPAWSPFLPHYFCHFHSSKRGKLTAGDHGSVSGLPPEAIMA